MLAVLSPQLHDVHVQFEHQFYKGGTLLVAWRCVAPRLCCPFVGSRAGPKFTHPWRRGKLAQPLEAIVERLLHDRQADRRVDVRHHQQE